MPGLDISELSRDAMLFETRLDRIKAELAPQGIVWYPYRTLLSFGVFDKLLTGPRRQLLDISGGDPILDLGCADGLLSFFLESLGCSVFAIDNPHVNHNQMRGFNALHAALQSRVAFETVDLDTQFRLPQDVFGLAMFLGVLYHLKNPYFLLEALAKRARYCLLSTRIAQRTPQGNPMKDESLAYFLAPGETNKDSTNYWIFSETALRIMLDRTGWTICDFHTKGCIKGSEPSREDRDERAFCLLESRHCPRYSVHLKEGWHALEQNSFRWTESRFSIEINRPHLIHFSTFRFDFRLPSTGPVTLSSKVNGVEMPPASFDGEREQFYSIQIPNEALQGAAIRIDFAIDKWLPAGPADERELGLLVAFWQPGLKGPDSLLPFVFS